jgi:hypothetical protein
MKNTIRSSSSLSQNLPSFVLFVFSFTVFATVLLSSFHFLNKGKLAPNHTAAISGHIPWRVFDGGVDDPGANFNETTISTGNVSKLTKLWQAALPFDADNAVVEEPNVSTSSGTKDLVIVNTLKGNVVAYDAATGTKIWEADPDSSLYNGQGTNSTPAIDATGSFVYSYAIDGYVRKYNITNGAEITGTGFPAQVTLLPNDTEKGSASINIANGYLYMTLAGNDGDYGHYVGHVVAVNLSTGVKTVWNANCSNIKQLLTTAGANSCADIMNGIWARPGTKVDPVTGNVYVVSGNGPYNANSGGNDWGDSIIELKPDLSQVVDSYTPANYNTLEGTDADLGSTAPVILPTQANSNTPYMMVQSGKDKIVKLLNRANLSGQGGPRHTGGELQTITISGQVREQPAMWVDGSGNTWVYITDSASNLYGYKLVTTNGVSTLTQVFKKASIASSSPFVANGVVYLTGNNILAVDAATGTTLFNSSSIGISILMHWASPIVVNGTLFTVNNGTSLYALGLPATAPTVNISANPATVSSGSSSTLTWSSTNTTSCTASGAWTGSQATSGTLAVSPTSTSTYTLSCTGAGGSTNGSATVTVNTITPPPPPPPPKPGDINGDNQVSITDLSLLLSSYGQNTTQCITNNAYKCDLSSPGDNIVNIFDLSILLSNYGK